MEEIEDKDLAKRIREKVNSFNQNGALISLVIMVVYLLVPDFSVATTAVQAANGEVSSNGMSDLKHFMHKEGSGLKNFMHVDSEAIEEYLVEKEDEQRAQQICARGDDWNANSYYLLGYTRSIFSDKRNKSARMVSYRIIIRDVIL